MTQAILYLSGLAELSPAMIVEVQVNRPNCNGDQGENTTDQTKDSNLHGPLNELDELLI
jgi:hypothetical protein